MKKEHSQEDEQFLQQVHNSIELVDNHYHVALLFKDCEVNLLNNQSQAMQRLMNLKRRLDRNHSYHQDYSAFMGNILEKGYAERIPDDEHFRGDGRVWYIPHHGEYHPTKQKIRVVFDCKANHEGVSLNNLLAITHKIL